MNNAKLRGPVEALPVAPAACRDDLPIAGRRPADVVMAHVHKTTPIRIATDRLGGTISYWENGAFHGVVEPMAEHVVMTFPTGSQRLERRTGKSVTIGTARPGAVTVIQAGSTARWDIHQPINTVQLYLPQATLENISGEADIVGTVDLLERTGYPDSTISRLLMSAADVMDCHEPLDALFRQQLTVRRQII